MQNTDHNLKVTHNSKITHNLKVTRKKMRLQKYLAHAGLCSRRKAEELIIDGKVKVNGAVVTKLGTTVSGKDVVEINGAVIKKTHDHVYILLNKPDGLCYDSKRSF